MVALAAGAEVGLQWDWAVTNTDGSPARVQDMRARVYKRTGTPYRYVLKATAATNAATVTLARGTHVLVAQAHYADAPQAVAGYSEPVKVTVDRNGGYTVTAGTTMVVK
jgi:hypothetical protein